MSRRPHRLLKFTASLAAFVSLGICVTGCTSTRADLDQIAKEPPLPYAVFVTGGMFLVGAPVPVDGSTPLRNTFQIPATAGEPNSTVAGEVVGFEEVLDVLRRGRVFVRSTADTDDARRAVLVTPPNDETRTRGVGSATAAGLEAQERADAALQAAIAEARATGHDWLLVVEGAHFVRPSKGGQRQTRKRTMGSNSCSGEAAQCVRQQ